ncbi:MAG: hypothetical protein D4R73_10655 [Deltaproteobacteria bacterium]|nr:MAG: hypothetical protein D4R73_10655 [Deltaproteobacteria bacterium]
MRFTLSWRRASLGKGRRPGAEWRELRPSWRRDETGAVAVITALCLTVFVALLALVLDIGHLVAVRGELQNAADAGALAGARALVPIIPLSHRSRTGFPARLGLSKRLRLTGPTAIN